jgi:hypothetical protein
VKMTPAPRLSSRSSSHKCSTASDDAFPFSPLDAMANDGAYIAVFRRRAVPFGTDEFMVGRPCGREQ